MEKEEYNKDILQYDDVRAACDFHKREGRKEGWAEGREEGRDNVCLNLITLGMNNEFIAAATQLSIERIEELRRQVGTEAMPE